MTQVICAVEVGWRGMRECSVALGARGADVRVLIKGEVPQDVLAMIRPKPGVTIQDAPERSFAWRLLAALWQPAGGERLLIVNKPKTQRWTAWVGRLRGWRVLRLEEAATGYRLFDISAQEVPLPWTSPDESSGSHDSGTGTRPPAALATPAALTSKPGGAT